MLKKISVLGGYDKNRRSESIRRLDIHAGEVLAVAGPTGSGKTQLITDIEQYADGETPTQRLILINDLSADYSNPDNISRRLTAEVSQKMNFVMDSSVEGFLYRHARVRSIENPDKIIGDVLKIANELAGEPISLEDNLTSLSGGQARALMVGDVALISNAPVVLIDEIENAGIDRLRAMEILKGQGKIVLVVTHDPILMLMADQRVIMKIGGMYRLHRTTSAEKNIMEQLVMLEKDISRLRNIVRSGESINQQIVFKEIISYGKNFITLPA
ncbi:MAG: ATP-binding cassette domain-containing protein [Deltaproteobacteria bacterium]|nr:ATP-binding cassette domain-containing protein [Deltaproteobacteria bacterium]